LYFHLTVLLKLFYLFKPVIIKICRLNWPLTLVFPVFLILSNVIKSLFFLLYLLNLLLQKCRWANFFNNQIQRFHFVDSSDSFTYRKKVFLFDLGHLVFVLFLRKHSRKLLKKTNNNLVMWFRLYLWLSLVG
jgi:hypothetical protein